MLTAFGTKRCATVADWHAELLTSAESSALVHGAPGLASIVPARQADHGAVLIGEDLACGSPLFDLGWILGEIVELRANTGRTSRAADTVCRSLS